MTQSELESVWAPRMLSILRIVVGLLFMEHGTQKLLGFPTPHDPGPPLFSLLGVQGVLWRSALREVHASSIGSLLAPQHDCINWIHATRSRLFGLTLGCCRQLIKADIQRGRVAGSLRHPNSGAIGCEADESRAPSIW